MRKIWSGAALAVVVAALAACSGNDSTGPSGNGSGMNGAWTFQELLTAASVGLTCADSATINLTQNRQAVTGNYVQTGVCSQGGQSGPNDGSGSIINGSINGDSIAFNEDICRYTGTFTGDPATHMSGTVDCPDTSTGQLIDITGTWVMAR